MINTSGDGSAHLSLMETMKSLGVEENSSKLAMSSCFTWTGSQSSMMNLREEQEGKQRNENSLSRGFMLHKLKNVPDLVATGVQHVHVHVLHQNG